MTRSAASAVLSITILVTGAVVTGCSDESPRSPTTPTGAVLSAVHVDGPVFRDEMGRQVLLRGYNARVQGIFDVTFDDGRITLEDIPPFVEADAQRFEELGLNVLRLPVNWSGLEPHPLQYGDAYMARIEATLELGRQHHFYVLIDMHQDAFSKEIGEDGAPLWAIVPHPTMLLQGPLNDLNDRRAASQTLRAFGTFFNNRLATDGRPLQDAFVAAVQQLVRRFKGHPALAGYEAFNEPVLTDDGLLDAFHARFAAGVHSIDPEAAVFFEPIAFRNQMDAARIATAPWSHGPGVYAPHIYTAIFSAPNDGWASEDPTILAPSMEAAAGEAAAWGTPLFVGEYGTDQSAERGHRWLGAELDLQDRFLASSTIWVWRETGSWGLRTGAGEERALTAHTVSRPFPRAVAGDLLAITRPAPGGLRVRYRATPQSSAQPHEVSVSSASLSNYEIRCDGTPTVAQRFTGRATFTCPPGDGEHSFEVIGTPAE